MIELELRGVPGLRNRVRENRERRGWSQDRLAERIGRSRETVSRLENGEIKLTDEYLGLLSEAFGCSPLELIADLDDVARDAGEREILELYRGMTPEAVAAWLATGRVVARKS